jgi:hypothetical protein
MWTGYNNTYIDTYQSCFIPEGVAVSYIFLRDAHVLPYYLAMRCSGETINLIIAFYDIHGRKREVPFFYFVPDTTRDFSEFILIFQRISELCL